MSKQTLIKKIDALPPERIAEVENFVDFLCHRDEQYRTAQTAEDKLEQRLYELGIVSEIKPPITDFTPYHNRTPIENKGKPVSEVIIEERR